MSLQISEHCPKQVSLNIPMAASFGHGMYELHLKGKLYIYRRNSFWEFWIRLRPWQLMWFVVVFVICYTTNAARYNFVSSQYSESVHFIIWKENRSNKIMICYTVWYNKSSWIIDRCFIFHTTNLALSNLTCCTGIRFRWKSWGHCVISGQRVTRR